MVVRTWFLAAMAMAFGASAQSPTQLLNSGRPADRAWGAYLAARSHDPSLREPLLAALRDPERWRDSPLDSEPWLAVQAIFDALIQSGDPVPAEIILPFAERWRDSVLLLLARGGASEETLLALREQKQNLAEWVAVNDLLFRMKSQRFFAKTLQEIEIGPIFEVRDTGEEAAYCGGGFDSSMRQRKLLEGFPPIALYHLEVEFIAPLQSTSVAIEGPTNVYVRRVVMETGKPVDWEDLGLDTVPGIYRERYLAALGSLTQEQMTQLLHPFIRIYWEGAEQVSREMARNMDQQATAIRDFVSGAGSAGLGSVAGMRLKIQPEVHDIRRMTHQPLAKVEAREILLE
jgi:hypothetical protein